MKLFTYILTFFFSFAVFGQTSAEFEELVKQDQIQYIKTGSEDGKIEWKKIDSEEVLSIQTINQPKFIYSISSNLPIEKQNFKKGDVFLLSFEAKTTQASLETGEARIKWLLKQSDNYKGNLESTLSLASEWKTYNIPFQATKDIEKADLNVVMQLGFREQTFLMKNISFKVYEKGTSLEELPKTEITYQGMEEDAEWRKKALTRIDRLRKGNFSLHLEKDGKPLAGKIINVKLIKHHFPFGAALNAKYVVNHHQEYQDFLKAFNLAVFENDLKIKSWGKPAQRKRTLKAMEILQKDGIEIKGHVLIWPGFNYLTPEIREHKNNPEKVSEIIHQHVTDLLEDTQGKITHWDVVNEAYTNRDLQNITGSEEILYDGFRILKEKQPGVLRFVNEYGIISKGGIDTQKQQWYYDYIKRIDEHTGGLVQGIGIQSHIGSDLTPPEKVIEILSFYATLGKRISISEFTMDIKDEKIREQYTRDFMIAALSHPNVSEFLFWGSTLDERQKVDIFLENGELGAMGRAYFDLVHNQWNTQLNLKTNEKGNVSGTGFFGVYEYSFTENGKVKNGTFEVLPRKSNAYQIEW